MTGLSSSPLRMERQNSSLTGNDDRKLELEREKEREKGKGVDLKDSRKGRIGADDP